MLALGVCMQHCLAWACTEPLWIVYYAKCCWACTAAVVPAGYYLKTVGQVAPCPKGEWKAGIGPAGNCTKCAAGVTTAKEASTSSSECTLVAPGWYASAMVDGIVTDVLPCPQGYW